MTVVNVTPLIAQDLLIKEYYYPQEMMPVEDINRLLWWEDLVLYDLLKNLQPKRYRGEEEVIRNITLEVDFAKLVKKFPSVVVEVPHRFAKIPAHDIMRKEFQDIYNEEDIKDLGYWTVKKHTSIRYSLSPKKDAAFHRTMTELFQEYLDSPYSGADIKSQDSHNPMKFKFTALGTNYRITFLLSGKIRKIEVVNPDGSIPTTGQIFDMCRWAHEELSDIVTRAGICKKIEHEGEPEIEVSEECEL